MQLDSQEIAKLRRGERLDVDVPEVGDQCVVMRSTDLAHLLHTAHEGLLADVVTELVDAAFADDDANDPLMASYQSCRP